MACYGVPPDCLDWGQIAAANRSRLEPAAARAGSVEAAGRAADTGARRSAEPRALVTGDRGGSRRIGNRERG